VIISSVKPFQLMMGKIIGIGAVGLTQFVIWIVLTFAVSQIAMSLYGIDMSGSGQMDMVQGGQMAGNEEVAEIISRISTINFPLLLGSFLFYFIGGYFFYGSLFAGVGSAVDNDSDAQQFQLPITLPLIFSIIILSAIIRDPHGDLAFWTSVIPFTSPVVMMMRIPFGPPAWHIALSMICLVLGFLGTTWLAGRIYRVGILMHGTKVNYKILAKWFMMKN
jgi:ABC-2 type transport system permease protein